MLTDLWRKWREPKPLMKAICLKLTATGFSSMNTVIRKANRYC